jgi:hypothetical protein
MIVMFLGCIVMSWVNVKMQAGRQKEAVTAIKKLGESLVYDCYRGALSYRPSITPTCCTFRKP